MNNPFVLLGIAFGLLVVFYFLFRRKPAQSPGQDDKLAEQDVFIFDPAREQIKPLSRRKVTVMAPAQTVAGVKRKLRVEAKNLPTIDVQVPQGKGIDALLVLVIDDRVMLADSDQELFEFNPPLTYSIEYTKEDAEGVSKNVDGTPKLSIVTGYRADDGWKFERLNTKVEPNSATGGGTLTAELANMHPKDPKWIGNP